MKGFEPMRVMDGRSGNEVDDRRIAALCDRLAVDAAAAAARLRPVVRDTPLDHSPRFSEATGAEVWLKRENFQITGSFKLRGAANRLLTLTAAQRAAGCVAASSGNHGIAFAHAVRVLDVPGIVFVPEHASPAKVASIRALGVDVRVFGKDGLDTEHHARSYAAAQGMFYLSPYNDIDVVAGQGSCGIEIVRDLPDCDVAFVAVGGGGLIGGIGAVLKAHRPSVRIVACQPSASDVMARSVAAGRILALPSEPTLSDGTAGGIEAGAITFDLCAQLVDEFVTVSESAIAKAMRCFIDYERQLIEGAAGVAIAALLDSASSIRGKKVVVVVCGGNVDRETLRQVLEPDA